MRKGWDREKKKGEKTDDYSGHYIIVSSRLPERRPLERCTLVPIILSQTGERMTDGGLRTVIIMLLIPAGGLALAELGIT